MGLEKGKLEGKLEGIQIREEKCKLERNIEIARVMLHKGYTLEDIMLLTGLSRSHIHDLI